MQAPYWSRKAEAGGCLAAPRSASLKYLGEKTLSQKKADTCTKTGGCPLPSTLGPQHGHTYKYVRCVYTHRHTKTHTDKRQTDTQTYTHRGEVGETDALPLEEVSGKCFQFPVLSLAGHNVLLSSLLTGLLSQRAI